MVRNCRKKETNLYDGVFPKVGFTHETVARAAPNILSEHVQVYQNNHKSKNVIYVTCNVGTVFCILNSLRVCYQFHKGKLTLSAKGSSLILP